MKKILIAVAIVVVLVIGVIAVRNIRLGGSLLAGEKQVVKRGNLVIPVTSNGTIEPNRLIQIKSKASGQVKDILVKAGQMVTAGEELVRLDPVDENRNVEARQAELERATSAWEKAKIELENAEKDLPLQTALAELKLLDAKAQLESAEYDYENMKKYYAGDAAAPVELVHAKMTYARAKALAGSSEQDLARARNNEGIVVRSAAEDVHQADAVCDAAKKNLEEARQRLKETTVTARSDGMIYNILISGGEVIQGGVNTFTGGTLLMTEANTSAVFVMAQVDESDIGEIRRIAPEHAKPGHTRQLSSDESSHVRSLLVPANGGAGEPAPGPILPPSSRPAGSQPASGDEPVATTQEAEEVRKALVGLPVQVTVEAYRDETYTGVIEQILPEPKRVTNVLSFTVRIRLVGHELEKLLGHQADCEFTTEKKENVVLVTNDALQSEGREVFVWVPKASNYSGGPVGKEKRKVKIGKTDGTYSEIISGLNEGDEVWTRVPTMTAREKEEEQKRS